ncbi:MAG: WD40 repeat domain-containing protein [Gemmataceae bacterium]|nr:WD40 repeat domain-containing protein [Gemmataceae bacterium]
MVYRVLGPVAKGGGEISVRGRDGKELRVFREHAAPLHLESHFSPDDRLVLTSSRDGAVKIWEADTGVVRWNFDIPVAGLGGLTRQKYSLGGRFVALPTPTGMKVVEFDSLRDRFPLERAAEASFSLDGRRLLSWHPVKNPIAMRRSSQLGGGQWGGQGGRNSDRGELKLWDVTAGKELWSETFEELKGDFIFSPDGRFFALTNVGRESVVEVWDATTGAKRFEIPSKHEMASYVFSPDGSRLVLSEREAESVPPAVWDTATGKQLFRLEGIDSRQRCFFSPDGKRIVTTDQQLGSGQVRLWDARTGRELLTLSNSLASPDFTNAGFTLTFSADGQRLVVPSDPLRGNPARTLWDATPRPEPKQP